MYDPGTGRPAAAMDRSNACRNPACGALRDASAHYCSRCGTPTKPDYERIAGVAILIVLAATCVALGIVALLARL